MAVGSTILESFGVMCKAGGTPRIGVKKIGVMGSSADSLGLGWVSLSNAGQAQSLATTF